MIQQDISYTNFNGVDKTSTLYFHITKSELMDNTQLMPKLEALEAIFKGEKKSLTMEEAKKVLDVVKDLIRISYGERSDDGEYFRKSEEIFNNFEHSAKYDQFLFSLFEDADRAVAFMLGIVPSDLLEEVQKANTGEAAVIQSPQPDIRPTSPPLVSEQRIDPVLPGDQKPTAEDISNMTPDQLRAYAQQSIRN